MVNIFDAFAEAPFEHVQHNIFNRFFFQDVELMKFIVFQEPGNAFYQLFLLKDDAEINEKRDIGLFISVYLSLYLLNILKQ